MNVSNMLIICFIIVGILNGYNYVADNNTDSNNTQLITCTANEPCNIYCSDEEGCDVVNASLASSLNLTCQDCIQTIIYCPISINSKCDIRCISNENNFTNLTSCYEAKVSYGPYSYNQTYLSLQCEAYHSCYDMIVNVRNASQIDINCSTSNSCSKLTVYAPYLYQSANIHCNGNDSCTDIVWNIDFIDYEYQFVKIHCVNSDDCGRLELQCFTPRYWPYTKYMYLLGNTPYCNDWSCCPLTHTHIYCDSNNTNQTEVTEQCVLNCTGRNSQNMDAVICSSNTIHDANIINCLADTTRQCNHMTIYCPQDNCELNCKLLYLITYTGSCSSVNILSNSTQVLNVNCESGMCNSLIISGISSQSGMININCYGDESCDRMNISAPGIDTLNISCKFVYSYFSQRFALGNCLSVQIYAPNSRSINIITNPGQSSKSYSRDCRDYVAAMQTAVIDVSNSKSFSLQCIGHKPYIVQIMYEDYSFYGILACDSISIYGAIQNNISCYGPSCGNMMLYIPDTNMTQLYGSFHQSCDLRVKPWTIKCMYNYSFINSSSFNGKSCSNHNCCVCDEDIWDINNDQCFWELQNQYLFYFSILFGCILLFAFLLMMFSWINYLKKIRLFPYKSYNIGYKPPICILYYLQFIDFMLFPCMLYTLSCFILTTKELVPYCHNIMEDRCDSIITCNMDNVYNNRCRTLGRIWQNSLGLKQCGMGQVFQGLSITFYVFCGLYLLGPVCQWVCTECGECAKNSPYRCMCIPVSSFWYFLVSSFWYKHSITTWRELITEKYYKIVLFPKCNKYSDCKYLPRVMIITVMLGMANVTGIFVDEFYTFCEWFVIAPITLSLIMAQILKLYYFTLVPYDEKELVKFFLLQKFGYDISSVILLFLYSENEENVYNHYNDHENNGMESKLLDDDGDKLTELSSITFTGHSAEQGLLLSHNKATYQSMED